MGGVFVLGSINQDYVVFADRRPRAGETVTGVMATRPGGKGANQAVAAADSGAAVMLLARIGDDVAGSAQRDDLAARGVDVSLVTATPNMSTGTAFVTVTPDGENSVLVAPGANGLVQPRDVKAAASSIADHSVLVAQLEVPVDAVVEAVRLCGPSTHVLLNAAPFAPLPGAMLERVDTLVVNKVEAAAMVGAPIVGIADALDGATMLIGRGVRAAVVTLGRRRGGGRHRRKLRPHPRSARARDRHDRGWGCLRWNAGRAHRRRPTPGSGGRDRRRASVRLCLIGWRTRTYAVGTRDIEKLVTPQSPMP